MTSRQKLRTRPPTATRTVAPPRNPADWAIATGLLGRAGLSTNLLPGYDAIIDAFVLYESCQDDAAREKLNAIGLSSPFLEWKLLLRGLMAYAAGDDGRALDNWGRLDANRLPARLAAPLRAMIEPKYRVAQSPAQQARLREKGDRLRGGSLAALRAIQADLGMPDRLPQALQLLKRTLPAIRRELPQLEPILARCCYSAALVGHPDGAWLYKDVFGPPADDPTLSRLQALAAEQRHEWSAANRHWQHFASALLENGAWLAADCNRAQAMIWCRCAENARRSLAESGHASLRARPNAEQCFRKAIAIDPTFEDGYAGLFGLYKERQPAKALAIGRQFVARFPDHMPAIIELAFVARAQGELDIALDCASRARTLCPFDRKLSRLAEDTLRARARLNCASNQTRQAFADLDEAERHAGRASIGLLAQRAVVALKSGDAARSSEFATRAREQHAVAAALALAAEAARGKLPRQLRKPLDDELTESLSSDGDSAAALRLAEILLEHSVQGDEYVGFKSHQSTVKKYVERSGAIGCSVATGELLCETLELLQWPKTLRTIAAGAARQFPRDPAFAYYQARSYTLNKELRSYWRVEQFLDRARHLAQKVPAGDPRGKKYLDAVAALQAQLDRESRALPLLRDIFDLFDV